MEEEDKVIEPTIETEEETVETPEEDVNEKLTKAEEIANNQKIRAEKAERELKELRSKNIPESNNENQSLTAKDTLALIEAKVSSEDFDEVTRVAKILGKPVSEALKDTTLQTILATRGEERRTANATMTRGGTRGASKVDGEDLLRRAETTGEVPDSEADMQKLFQARQARKLKR